MGLYYKDKKHYNFFITTTIVILFLLTTLLSVGFSALNQDLSVSGDIDYQKYSPTLYNVLKKEADIGTYAKEYTNSHRDSFTENPSENIYHWYAVSDSNANIVKDKWNVIFGGFCWQMIRTTDTGGVKLIYNGIPSNGQCNNSDSIYRGKFNANYSSPAYVGYMYNPSTLIAYKGNYAAETGSLFGTGVTYSEGIYTLTNTSTTLDNNHHYILIHNLNKNLFYFHFHHLK